MTPFEVLTNNILLGIPTFQSDGQVKAFLTKYCPQLASKPTGTWRSMPPDKEPDNRIPVRHSLTLEKHPYLHQDIRELRLDILTKETPTGLSQVQTYFVGLIFDNDAAAKICFQALCNSYAPISHTKIITSKGGRHAAIFKPDEMTGPPERIEILLSTDELFNDRGRITIGIILDEEFEDYYAGDVRSCHNT